MELHNKNGKAHICVICIIMHIFIIRIIKGLLNNIDAIFYISKQGVKLILTYNFAQILRCYFN